MGDGRPPLATVDAVREELRRLGYLDSSLDRFVLGGAGDATPLRASLRAAWRVGVVGGVLFGLAATIAAAGLDRRLLGEPRDLLVLGVYLVVAFALLTGSLALAGGLLAAWSRRLGREPRAALARRVGLSVALLAAAYVALWWRSHLAGAPALGQAGALVLGLLLSLGLARFTSLAAVAVLSAGGASSQLPPASLSRRRILPLVLGAVALFALVVALSPRLSRPAGDPVPDYAVVPTGLRLRVLAIDGLERRMAQHLVALGEMPALAGLLASGAHARLRAEPERVPAIVWTTIATGRGPEAHGIRSADTRRITGLRTPVSLDAGRSPFASALGAATDLLRLTRPLPPSAVLRSVKAFWNVASEKGLRVGVVNWWATWPADAVNGYLVTDRAAFKLEKGGPTDREVHPQQAFERLRPLLDPSEREQSRRLDRFHLAAARSLRDGTPPDLEALYLPGLDIFTMQQLGEAPASDLEALDAKLAAVREGYRFVDRLIGEAAAGRGPTDVLVLVADPGRLARGGAQAAEGLLVLDGEPIAPGDLGTASERDVAPTVLHLLGLPKSRELEGHVLEAAFSEAFRRDHPVRLVDSYGARTPSRPARSDFDQDVLEQLKSLGYIR
ncbi:MAG TPA: alkaline phosphatase family protein [Vicinamibacteria bacterium]|nr:alkaline phosphatase family protein [Vicinamibacteria bacterium]